MIRKILAIGFSLALISCASRHPLTIAPAPPHAHTVSEWARLNIVDADAAGEIVTAEWVRVYHEMLKAYGDKLPVARRPASPDQGIVAIGTDRFHVDWTVKDRFVVLKSFDTP